MKKITTFFVVLVAFLGAQGQLLQMNFDVDASTTIVGPSPNSFSGSTGVVAGGSSNNGLAARFSNAVIKQDIDMDFNNTGNIWNVDGIDFSIDFQRDESEGSFVRRMGHTFNFGMSGGNLNVTYTVDNGAGGSTTVSSGNIYSIPNDNTWRTYRFRYDPYSGIGEIWVNGVSQWTNDGPNDRVMTWTGATSLRIGDNMDASGSNRAIFDNLSVTGLSYVVLPIELAFFNAKANGSSALLEWATYTEINNERFEIQTSKADQIDWQTIGIVEGKGTSNDYNTYSFEDKSPIGEKVMYRLKQVDFDGQYELHKIEYVAFNNMLMNDLTCYPNPTNGWIKFNTSEEVIQVQVYDLKGNNVLNFSNSSGIYTLDLSELQNGYYALSCTTAAGQKKAIKLMVI